MRCDRRQYKILSSRQNHRTTTTQRIARRARRRSNHKPISPIRTKVITIQFRINSNHRSRIFSRNSNFVHRKINLSHRRQIIAKYSLYYRAFHNFVRTFPQLLHHRLQIILMSRSQKTQPTQYRNFQIPNIANTLQQRAIATNCQHHIKRIIQVLKTTKTTQTLKSITMRSKLI